MKELHFDLKPVRDQIMNFFFPTFCCCCNEPIGAGEIICSECEEKLKDLTVKKPKICSLNGRRYRIHAVYEYADDNAASDIVKKLKFGKKRYGAVFVGKKIAERARRLNREFDLVGFVPLTDSAENERMFNHCENIARNVARELKVREYDVLLKTRETARQHTLSRTDRKRNLRGAFLADEIVKGKRILFVDDVVTTGATFCECAQELYRKGAVSVTMIAFCMTGRKH